MTIETILKNLKYRRMDIRFYVERQVRMRHWIGAALRNNFLCAAEEVRNAQGVSLRQRLDTLPLPKENFLYKQFCGGFPKSFFFDASALPYEAPGFVFQPNREYKVSLIQIGSRFHEEEAFLEAIRRMFSKGFGHPVTPLTLLDVTEEMRFFVPQKDDVKRNVRVEFTFKTPVSLMRFSNEESQGYQNKLNNFPSFYQLMRSLTYRVLSLGVLYGDASSVWSDRMQMEEWVQSYIAPSVRAMLTQANLRYEKRYSTPKEGKKSVYVMGGYVGKLVFVGVPSVYIPVLDFASNFGVGGDIQYGLGMFDVRYRENQSGI